MTTVSRRHFLRGTVLAAGAVALAPRSWSRVIGANDEIRVAVAGIRGKGAQHIQEYRRMKGVRVVGLCDPDRDVLERGAAAFREKGEPVAAYTDVRKLLENPEIDCLSIATPHHWHALMTVWACQAGKDVYVEKMASHNVWEGRKMVEAARKYDRIVQVGSQKRSDAGTREAVAWLRAGHLGKMVVARGFCYKQRGSIGKVSGPQPIPANIDYDVYQGPAPLKPLMRKSLHYDWHWFWDTGNGDLGNQGIHEMDVCRWFAGAVGAAPRILSVGGRFGYDDDGETPNTEFVYQEYPDAPAILFEVRGLTENPTNSAMPHYKGVRIGNVIECEGGYVAGGWAYDKAGAKVQQFKGDGGGDHFGNFIRAVRSHKMADLNADILEGHLSATLCHTGSISHRLGRERPAGEIQEEIKAYPQASEAFARMQQHLAAHKVDLALTQAVCGAWLNFDAKAETFVGPHAEEANPLLTRDYRAPFVVPEKV